MTSPRRPTFTLADSQPGRPHPASGAPQRADASTSRRVTSGELLAGGTELEIDHAGCTYRLRITSLGKLILTK